MVVNVGLLGCGVVGSAVVRGLNQLPAAMRPSLRSVAVRDVRSARDCHVNPAVLTCDARAVVEDPSVQVIVETLGGIDPAAELIALALSESKPVVTANKAVLGAYGPVLRRWAADSGAPLLFEAAVAGAVPVIRGLSGLLRADEIVKIEGVLNGTTTFMLSYVEETGATISEALAEARRFGLCEPDWSRDLDGSDAADKLAVLAQYLFGSEVYSSDVDRAGIERLDRDDILGNGDRSWRLLATAVRDGEARVEPVALRRDHPFARLSGPQNAVTITGTRSGAVTLIGTGGGGEAAACSIIADVLSASDWLGSSADASGAAVGV